MSMTVMIMTVITSDCYYNSQPSVREMSSLLEQNRKLREELGQVTKERSQLKDRVKTLECQVSGKVVAAGYTVHTSLLCG